jgi:hypothetical protein
MCGVINRHMLIEHGLLNSYNKHNTHYLTELSIQKQTSTNSSLKSRLAGFLLEILLLVMILVSAIEHIISVDTSKCGIEHKYTFMSCDS